MSSRDSTTPNALTPLSEQAAYWWVMLRDGECTDADRSAFAQWVTRSPERVEAYLRVASFMAKLQSRDLQWPDDATEALIAAAKAEGAEVVHLPTPVAREQEPAIPTRLRRLRGPLAAAALLALVTTVAWLSFAAPHRYQTAPGEQRTVALSDGSFMTLSPSTAVEVDYRRDRRLVHIPGGEALFQVAHEGGRPFEVIDPRVVVRAVGTRFHVDCREHQTTVTVLDGSVVVERRGPGPSFSPVVLAAAERVVVRESGDPSFSRLPEARNQNPDGRPSRQTSTDERDEPPPGVQQILPRGGIPAVFDPQFVPAAKASIPDDAWVLGVVVEGTPKAYSLNLLNRHEVVNDRSGNTDFAAVW